MGFAEAGQGIPGNPRESQGIPANPRVSPQEAFLYFLSLDAPAAGSAPFVILKIA